MIKAMAVCKKAHKSASSSSFPGLSSAEVGMFAFPEVSLLFPASLLFVAPHLTVLVTAPAILVVPNMSAILPGPASVVDGVVLMTAPVLVLQLLLYYRL